MPMNGVTIQKHQQIIPTYIPKPASELPMFFENKPYQGGSGRVYPIPYAEGIRDEKTDVAYEVYTLENEYIRAQALPEIGGKLLRGFDKLGNYDFIYYNEVIKPALVGLAGPWISGGIEFNWPQHHRPTTFMPLEAAVEEYPDGSKTVWMGEVEPLYRMKGMVGITLDPGRSYIKAKVRLYNRTDLPQPFLWWANLAAPANPDYRTVFPPDCEWVNDHDRRAVMSWPIAKGVYHTARPYDFGEGTDLTRYDAVRVPSSYLISQGQSDMDFVSGYDTARQKGIVTVADHHIAPGKKLWHWGIGDFGDMWCSNLTDQNGPYIELMTGVYTDNQPDFTWLAPYESREFEQYWYPIRDIGEIKNATIDAAMNMEQRSDGLFIGFHVTGVFRAATVRAAKGTQVLFSETVDLTPDTPYVKTLSDIQDSSGVTVSLIGADGRTLVCYTPYVRGQKKPIEPRRPVARPSEIPTVEELYINGYHLEQYKQHNYRAEDYYEEGLRRDPGDIRCNTSMARSCFKNGDFLGCLDYCDRALERLTSRNEHPTDTEPMYLKGVALTYLERYEEAYDLLSRAAWNYTHRSAACFALANLDCRRGDWEAAKAHLADSLALNSGHLKARNLLTAILRRTDPAAARQAAEQQNAADPLDLFAKVEYSHMADNRADLEQFIQKPENLLDVAADYICAGFYEDALYTLGLAEGDYPLVRYYQAYCSRRLGRDGMDYLTQACAMDTGRCFPSRLMDIAVLQEAAQINASDANAPYYLGNLYYDRFRYTAAADCWERCVLLAPTHAKAWRNLALYYFDKKGEANRARECMENALRNRPEDPRLLFEYQQLLKNMNRSIQERLDVYERYPGLLAERDDCYLDRLTLLAQTGDYEQAISLAAVKRFHIYEGGEGKLTKMHAWIHVLYGNRLVGEGNETQAEKMYLNGIDMPKTYGEAKTFFNQEAHIYYFLGRLYGRQGKRQEERAAYEQAAVYKAAVSEISLFRALALEALGDPGTAEEVRREMLCTADRLITDKDLRSYYGVGSPTPMPFENDMEQNNLLDGYILRAFAWVGTDRQLAAEAIAAARQIRPYDFRIYAFEQVDRTLLAP